MARQRSRLQRRIAIALTLVVAVFVIIQGLLAYNALAEQEDELVNQFVQTEAQRLVREIERGEDDLPRDGSLSTLTARLSVRLLPLDRDLAVWAARLAAPAIALGEGVHVHKVNGSEVHSLLAKTSAGHLFLEYDASEDEAFVYRFGAYLVVTGLVICLLAALIAIGLSRLLVEPFSRIASHLSAWSPGQPALPAGQSDEEVMLLEAFETAQRRIDAALAREREFAANVRHEVRTPLSALRTDAEMLGLTQALDQAGRDRLLRMQATIDAIATDIESLHHLSKARPARPEPVDLAQCISDVWAALQHRNADGQLVLVNEVPPGEVVPLDRLALMTILRNLLRNAIDHASPGRCQVQRIPDGLLIRDQGPGIALDDLPRIFDRYFSRRRADTVGATSEDDDADTERGLGLAIAQQTAIARGWRLQVSSRLGEGTTFTLHFDSDSTQIR